MFEGFSRTTVETPAAEIAVRHSLGGSPLVLLHGYPQTGAMWDAVARGLADKYAVVVPDLRGYGRSTGPSDPDTTDYSNRAMGDDVVRVARELGFDEFGLAGHDRGARVAYRLALDHAGAVSRLALLDIIPTLETFERITHESAHGLYHWFFLAQPHPFPETLISGVPEYYLEYMLEKFEGHPDAFAPDALSEYRESFRQESVIRASCEDYRAGASVDLEHDRRDRAANNRISCPTLVVWGEGESGTEGVSDPLSIWKEWADDVRGWGLDCGHFLPEEAPGAVTRDLAEFFAP